MPNIERRVGVVVPYYQREEGLLRRALQSVATQKLPPGVRMTIIVVDDESPWPAEKEVAGLAWPPSCELIVIRQLNAGPAAARNAAMDRLQPDQIDYVAFLDSDDRWYPEHLSTAIRHLRGSDFYFANVDEEETDFFSYSRYVADHHKRSGERGYTPASRVISGAEAFDALLHQCFVHTSQVVYRFNKYSDLRFATDQRRAGEDLLFWLELSRRCPVVSYSAASMGARGWGVSIYRETLDWDSAHAIDGLIDGLKLQKKISALPVSGTTRHMLKRKRQKMRDRLMILLLRELLRRPRLVWRGLSKLSRELPEYLLLAPISFVRVPAHRKMLREDARRRSVQGSNVLKA